MFRRLSLFLACASLVIIVAGCDALTSTSGGGTPVMLVLLNARTKGATFTTNPVSNFYRVGSANFSSANSATDSCRLSSYDPNAVPAPITATSIGGGAYVAVMLSGRTDTLRKVSATDLTYRLATSAGMVFTPGDTITFTVPGDVSGFPGVSLQGRTAEPFTLSPIVVPTAGQPMTMTWTAATDANAAMIVSLRYNNGTGTGLNAQIFCDFKDDGSGTVTSALIAPWAASATREVFVQRLRTALIIVSGAYDSYFNMISTYDLPTPVSP
jgi:hypothetical protein